MIITSAVEEREKKKWNAEMEYRIFFPHNIRANGVARRIKEIEGVIGFEKRWKFDNRSSRCSWNRWYFRLKGEHAAGVDITDGYQDLCILAGETY